jgi:hypothetical protein
MRCGVYAQVLKRIAVLYEGGGYVFSTIHNLQAMVPVENTLALFQAIRDSREGWAQTCRIARLKGEALSDSFPS